VCQGSPDWSVSSLTCLACDVAFFTSPVCPPANVAVIPSTAKPATPTITLHTALFTLPPLPLLTGCSGVPTIQQVHYFHNDVAVLARFCYWFGGIRSTLGGSLAR